MPGCTADSNTICWLLETLKNKFTLANLKQITFVFDRGTVSEKNLSILEDDKIKYITAMDKNQLETIAEIDFTTFTHLLPEKIDEQADNLPEFKKINENTFAREMKVDGKRRYILCFNPQLFKDQRKSRKQALENYKTFASNLNLELLEAKKSRQKQPTYAKFEKRLKKVKISGFADVTLTQKHMDLPDKDGAVHKLRTCQAEVTVDDHKMLLSGKQDGFWLLVTNHAERKGKSFEVKTEEAIGTLSRKRSY